MERDRALTVTSFLFTALEDSNRPLGFVAHESNFEIGLNNVRIPILVSYFFDPEIRYQDLAEEHGVTKEAIRQVINKTLKAIWNASSDDLKKEFPLEELFSGKASKLKGINLTALSMLETGLTPQEVYERLGLNNYQATLVKEALERRGVEMDPKESKFRRKINAALSLRDDIRIKEFLEGVNNANYSSYSTEGVIVSISKIMSNFGCHPRSFPAIALVKILEKANIPVGFFERTVEGGENKGLVQRYNFIHRNSRDRALEVLSSNSEIQQFQKSKRIV